MFILIKKKACIDSDEEDCIKEFARHLLADLKFGLLDMTVRYANFLDPRLKGVHLRETNKIENMLSSIERHLSSFDEEQDINENLTATQKLLQEEGPSSNSIAVTHKHPKTAK